MEFQTSTQEQNHIFSDEIVISRFKLSKISDLYCNYQDTIVLHNVLYHLHATNKNTKGIISEIADVIYTPAAAAE